MISKTAIPIVPLHSHPLKKWKKFCRLATIFCVLLCLLAGITYGQQPATSRGDTTKKFVQTTTIRAHDTTLRVAVRNLDITHFPIIGVVFDVYDTNYMFVDNLTKEDIEVTENGLSQEVLSLSFVSSTNRIPVDFVFVIDQTGSMGEKIAAVKQNIEDFTTRLSAKGIDYRLGLIVFDDYVATRRWLTDNIQEFKGWVDQIHASGGGDEKENALEAIRAATGMNFRSSANRCVVLVTDAPYHQYGEDGDGRTMYNTGTITTILNRYDIRTFCIVSPVVEGYSEIAWKTGGQRFDITQPFADILNRFVFTMTTLYNATYRSNTDIVPDSIEVVLRIGNSKNLVRKRFAVLEVGRKLVMENIHFGTNMYTISENTSKELDVLVRLMKVRPTMKVKIEGHTDVIGDHEANVQLSFLRAESVKQYLIQRGIARDRLFTIGYGETRPTASNDTDEGRRLNRRTEFIIVQK